MTMLPNPSDWDRRLHEALRQLPEHEAPASLVPNVLAAIEAREAGARAWYHQPATKWPVILRFALAILALALFAAIAFGASSIDPATGPTTMLGSIAHQALALAAGMRALGEALLLALNERLGVLGAVIIAVAVFSYLALLGLGGALWRAALHERRS